MVAGKPCSMSQITDCFLTKTSPWSCDYVLLKRCHPNYWLWATGVIFKASQPRGWASGSRAYEKHEMQGVIIKCTRHECSASREYPWCKERNALK